MVGSYPKSLAAKACEARTRRAFLQSLAASSAAALACGEPRALGNELAQQGSSSLAPRADCCILLWMAGGMAAPDTFDPKAYLPFEKGLAVERILSTFPAIETAVDGIRISAGFEQVAKIMDRATLVRSHVQPDLGNILHSRHQYHWHTGYVPPQTVAAPHLGAWMARVLGPINPVIPPFINIGQQIEGNGESEELKAFTTGGFFGSEFGPFNLPRAKEAIAAVQPPQGMSRERFVERYRRFQRLLKENPRNEYVSDYQQQSMLRAFENAQQLLGSPHRHAFDLSLEPRDSYDRYGISDFGQGCLLARRLVESGARFIEVTTEYIPFVHWDTHEKGHETVARMKREIDQPIAQLILDLEQRGLLDRTLVVLASEFSRDMLIEGVPGSSAQDQSRAKTDILQEMQQYGLHRHFTGGSSVLLFGGGIKQGLLYGATAPERPCIAIENPVTISELHATIFTAMGIRPDQAFEVERRPFYATQDGLGKPVAALFA